MKDKFKLPSGNEMLIGININNKWCVSCWDDDYDCVWSKEFNNEDEAIEYFDKVEMTVDFNF